MFRVTHHHLAGTVVNEPDLDAGAYSTKRALVEFDVITVFHRVSLSVGWVLGIALKVYNTLASPPPLAALFATAIGAFGLGSGRPAVNQQVLRRSRASDHPKEPVVAVSSALPAEFHRVHSGILRQGYAMTSDQAIGLPEKLRDHFVRTYFVDNVIHCAEGDLVVGRKRARDVIYYEWVDGELQLEEYETIHFVDREGHIMDGDGFEEGLRIYARVMLLDDPQAVEFIKKLLTLVPPERRQSKGTFGVNLFRTCAEIVKAPHRDVDEFSFTYVLNRVGGGAKTHLYDVNAATTIFEQQLQAGELLVFDDERFFHNASPLESDADGQAMRDAIICTVDYETTYLSSAR